MARFKNRQEAGIELARELIAYRNDPDTIVLALPRGGVVVAFEIAETLRLPLDIILVRKIGAPHNEEYAVGALAYPDTIVLHEGLIHRLHLSHEAIDEIIAREERELLRRNELYRRGQPQPNVRNRTVIIVDDGIATGSNMQAAIKSIREQKPAKIIIAVPVSSYEAFEELKGCVDDIVCAHIPTMMDSIGGFYGSFEQVGDDEVLHLLKESQTATEGWDLSSQKRIS